MYQISLSDPIDAEGMYPASYVAKHPLESGHKVNIRESFKIIYTNRRGTILRFAESLAIRMFHPALCIQKQFVRGLTY